MATTTAAISIINMPLGKDGKKAIKGEKKQKEVDEHPLPNLFKDFYKPLSLK